jgi:hypothetical protein
MFIKYDGFICECGNKIFPDFHELYFDMIDGEILDNLTDDITCDKCGLTYRLDDIKFIPSFRKVTSLD